MLLREKFILSRGSQQQERQSHRSEIQADTDLGLLGWQENSKQFVESLYDEHLYYILLSICAMHTVTKWHSCINCLFYRYLMLSEVSFSQQGLQLCPENIQGNFRKIVATFVGEVSTGSARNRLMFGRSRVAIKLDFKVMLWSSLCWKRPSLVLWSKKSVYAKLAEVPGSNLVASLTRLAVGWGSWPSEMSRNSQLWLLLVIKTSLIHELTNPVLHPTQDPN